LRAPRPAFRPEAKLATAIIGVSSIQPLQTYTNPATPDVNTMMWQAIFQLAFLVSAITISLIDRLMGVSIAEHAEKGVTPCRLFAQSI
jgi:uncharacterized protein (TIGR00645 family)